MYVFSIILQILFFIFGAYYFTVSLFAWFKRRERPILTDKTHTFALVVAAHNEEAVIENMVESLINLFNGKVLDTPGFSSIDLKSYSIDQIKNAFIEFNKYTCPYKNCNHINEVDCMVKKACNDGKILKSRYENYIKFIEKR